MSARRRWVVRNRYGNDIYLTDERWGHIIAPMNHPEMSAFEEHLKETIQSGRRKQDLLNAQKYRYTKSFDDLGEDNTHIVAIVLFRFIQGASGEPIANNYVVAAYQKELG